VMGLAGKWGDTSVTLPHGRWHSAFGGSSHTGGEKRVSDLLKDFPVELLVRK
jgi:maltooligosyltrehalose synthase